MPSNTVSVSQLYETGNKKFFAASRNADGTFGTKEYHEGLMEVNIEFKSEATDINADDDVSFIRLNTQVQGEGTIKFAVLPFNVYSKFFDVKIDNNGAIVIKSKAKSKEVAFGYYSSVGDGSESMFTMYRAVFQLPSLSSTSFDGKTIRDITLNVSVYPFEYIDHSNEKDKVTYTILNSSLNDDIWDDVQDDIYVPDCTITPPTPPPNSGNNGDQ